MNYFKFLALGLSLIFMQNNFAQGIIRSNISSFGSQLTNGEYSISQTVGQPSNTSVFINDKATFRQGFQQPLKSISKSVNNELISYSIYPNPNNGQFVIEVEMLNDSEYEFVIYNILGAKLYEDVAVSKVKKNVNITHLSEGVYILNIIENNYSLGNIKFVIY